MSVIPSVQFTGSISTTRNAISRSGGDGGGRVQFDIPDCDIAQLAELMNLTGRPLIVTVIDATNLDGAEGAEASS